MSPTSHCYYTILGVDPRADFDALRKAYRRRAMDCHPDLFAGQPTKTEEFKVLVEAFNVLSDPLRRREYDLSQGVDTDAPRTSEPYEKGFYPEDHAAILDTLADDILEELIVGNVVPEDASIQTLMLDLERTERFCLFREAKTRLYQGATVAAEGLFGRYIDAAPFNILARYFMSRCLRANGRWKEAEHQLVAAIRIGEARVPPLRLVRIRNELATLRRQRPGLIGILRRLLGNPQAAQDSLSTAESERYALNREINRLAAARHRRRPSRGRLTPLIERGKS